MTHWITLTELTFIIHARRPLSESPAAEEPSPEMRWDWDALCAMPMVGDVNLFLKESPEDEFFEAEAEIMIAGECCAETAPQVYALRQTYLHVSAVLFVSCIQSDDDISAASTLSFWAYPLHLPSCRVLTEDVHAYELASRVLSGLVLIAIVRHSRR